MTDPRNEHEDFAAYEAGGLEAVAGIPPARAQSLANVLSIEVTRMDPRHPATEIVKRDLARLHELMHPPTPAASQADRAQADRAIAHWTKHPAYMDASHPEHASVKAQAKAAFAVRYQGEE